MFQRESLLSLKHASHLVSSNLCSFASQDREGTPEKDILEKYCCRE